MKVFLIFHHIIHRSIWILTHFIQCKKGHFAPFNAVIGVINLALYLYVKLKTFSRWVRRLHQHKQASTASEVSLHFSAFMSDNTVNTDIVIWDCSNNLFCWLSMAYRPWKTERIYTPTPSKTQYVWYFTRRKRFPVYIIA